MQTGIAMYDHILVPTDGSEGSRRAIEHAVAVADEVDATVHALFVVDATEYRALGGAALETIETSGREGLAAVEKAAERADVEVETEVRRGEVDSEILAAVTDTDADAIVMGTHGRTGLDRVLLGSVTERVVREATVPVITVRMVDETPAVDTPGAAIERAEAALADAGHAPVEPLEEPYRGTSAWIVPFRAEGGEFRVHIDATTGNTRIARTDD
ncbi:universal stress protein [Halostella salina]|uniref:universal stress protein n=1 Tax=Halostella salina TaxID=1547897 RepID=UPI000EF79BA6|nr:universal stress protein [Halostella salina]